MAISVSYSKHQRVFCGFMVSYENNFIGFIPTTWSFPYIWKTDYVRIIPFQFLDEKIVGVIDVCVIVL